MNKEEPKLINPKTTIKTIKKMGDACIIVGGPEDQVYGTLDFTTMFIWTSQEKANDFITKNLDAKEDKIIEKPMKELIELARTLGFIIVRFDFQAKGVHPKQTFVNYNLQRIGDLDLIAAFNLLEEK